MPNIEADLRKLFEAWHLSFHHSPRDNCWLAFQAGWGEALLYAAQAREAERKWIADGRPE